MEDGVATCSTYYNDESVTSSEEREPLRLGQGAMHESAPPRELQVQPHCDQAFNVQQQQRSENDKDSDRAARVEAQLEGGVVRSHLLLKRSSTGCSSDLYLNDDECNRLLHYAKMDFARSGSESASSDQEQTSSV